MVPPKLLRMPAHGASLCLAYPAIGSLRSVSPMATAPELPAPNFAGRLVDVEEVEIAAIEKRRSRAARQLWSGRDMVEVRAPDDIRSQVE